MSAAGFPLCDFSASSMFGCVLYQPPNSDHSIYLILSDVIDQLLTTHPNSFPYNVVITTINMQIGWVFIPLSPAMALQQRTYVTP